MFQSYIDQIVNVLAASVNSLTKSKKLTDNFRSKGIKVSEPTIKSYLQESFLISKAQRFDVKG